MTVPFENDTGNIVRKLARKSLKSEKRRNLMVVIAVALASCLICFSIVMALSTRQIERNHVGRSLICQRSTKKYWLSGRQLLSSSRA